MIQYRRYELANGLRVLIHCDTTTPLVTMNLLYCVGSRNERSDRTGFAHLFEHLMFGGTRRYPDFDCIVNNMGGDSNAFTNSDFTNYYITVSAESLEQALLLEADRMGINNEYGDPNEGELSIVGSRNLEVQKRVVTEEYHQRYMNEPYGDVWMVLRPLCYKVHPYRWCTIGADIRHVQEATLEDVKDFYTRFYRPENAILAVAGNLDEDRALVLIKKVFGGQKKEVEIERMDGEHDNQPFSLLNSRLTEPQQTEPRRQEVVRDVPNNALYKAWVMCDRWDADYYVYDMISDVLSNGHSSRLYRRLVIEKHLFTEINAYITGDLGPGLFVISGKLCDGVSFEEAEQAIDEEVKKLADKMVDAHELEKVANKFENTFVYSQYKANDRAMNLCYFEMIGQLDLVNREPECYRSVTPQDLQRVARSLTSNRACTLLVRSSKNDTNEEL